MKGKKDGKIILMLGCLAFMFVSHAYGIAWTNTGYEFGVYNPEGVSYNVDTQDLDWGFTNHDLKTYSTDILRIMSGTSGNFIGSGGWCTHQKFNFNDGAMVCEYTIEDNPTVNTHNQSNATNSRSGGLAANPSILTTPLPAGKPGEMEIYPIASVDCNKAWVLGVRYGNKGGGFFYLRTPKPYTNLCDWMAALPEDATLKELYLPGAHDAATEYNGGRFIPIAPLLLLDVVNPVVQIADFLVNYYEFMAEGKDATASCQKYNFLDMLNQGTRYFDMRVVKRTSMVTLSSLGTETKTADLSDADKYITKNTSRSNSDLLLFKNIVTYGVDVPHVTDSSGAVMMSVHGNPCITYDTMDDLMRQVETFSLNHPSEIIVLGFQQIDVQSGSSPLALPLDAEGDATPNDPPLWAKTLYDTLEKDHHLLIRPSDKVTHNSTLQQLRASNSGTGRIFVVVRDKVYAAYKDSTIEGTNYKVSDLFFDMGAVIQSPYGDQQSSYTDQAKSMAGFIDTNKGKDTIFVNQAQMTATNVNYAGDLLLGKTLYDFTGTYYLDMIKTLISERHTMGSYPSVILYDFVNANVNRFIIDWNFANMAIQPPPLPGFNAGQLYAYAEAYDYSADVAQGQDVSNAKLCFAAIGDTLFRTQQKYDPLTAQNNTAIFSSPPNTYMGALSADAVFIEDNADAMSANLSAEQGSGGSYNNPKVLLSFIAKDPNSGVRTLYGAIAVSYTHLTLPTKRIV